MKKKIIKKKSDSKRAQSDDKIVSPNSFLETNQSHRKWYDSEVGMGKQRGKPHAVPPNKKKAKGEFKKHSLSGK